jgi:hypothetical protein
MKEGWEKKDKEERNVIGKRKEGFEFHFTKKKRHGWELCCSFIRMINYKSIF